VGGRGLGAGCTGRSGYSVDPVAGDVERDTTATGSEVHSHPPFLHHAHYSVPQFVNAGWHCCLSVSSSSLLPVLTLTYPHCTPLFSSELLSYESPALFWWLADAGSGGNEAATGLHARVRSCPSAPSLSLPSSSLYVPSLLFFARPLLELFR
jgi:hypothetical protein